MRWANGRISKAVLAAAVLLFFSAPGQASDALKEGERALQAYFGGKQIVAKIDLPSVRSLYVFPSGDFDEKRYYKRVKKFPPKVLCGDRAELRKVVVEKDRIALCINRCGLQKFAAGTTLFVSGGKKVGARIEIEFGRPATPADLRPEVVLAAVANVIEIEGVTALPPAPTESAAGVASAHVPMTDPDVKLLSAEVEPTKVRPGEPIGLIAHFEVSGMGSGELPVTLVRQLLADKTPLFSPALAETKSWPNGRHSSRMEMTIPASAALGVYTLEIILRGGALEATKSALFMVER